MLRLSREGRPTLFVSTASSYPKERPKVSDALRREIRIDGSWSPERFIVDLASKAEK